MKLGLIPVFAAGDVGERFGLPIKASICDCRYDGTVLASFQE